MRPLNTQRIKVDCCMNCPFASFRDGGGYCSKAARVIEIESITPTWCPLRKADIFVTIEIGVTW